MIGPLVNLELELGRNAVKAVEILDVPRVDLVEIWTTNLKEAMLKIVRLD